MKFPQDRHVGPLSHRPPPAAPCPAPTAPGGRSRRQRGPASRTRRSSSLCWGHRGRPFSGSRGTLRSGEEQNWSVRDPHTNPRRGPPRRARPPLTVLGARNSLHDRAAPPRPPFKPANPARPAHPPISAGRGRGSGRGSQSPLRRARPDPRPPPRPQGREQA